MAAYPALRIQRTGPVRWRGRRSDSGRRSGLAHQPARAVACLGAVAAFLPIFSSICIPLLECEPPAHADDALDRRRLTTSAGARVRVRKCSFNTIHLSVLSRSCRQPCWSFRLPAYQHVCLPKHRLSALWTHINKLLLLSRQLHSRLGVHWNSPFTAIAYARAKGSDPDAVGNLGERK